MIKTVIPLNNIVLFPKMIVTFDVTSKIYINILEKSQILNEEVFITLIVDDKKDIPLDKSLSKVGVLCKVIKVIKVSENVSRVYAETGKKATATTFMYDNDTIVADVKSARKEHFEETIETKAVLSSVKDNFLTYASQTGYAYTELLNEVRKSNDVDRICNIISYGLNIPAEEKLTLLAEKSPEKRLYKILEILLRELSNIQVKNDVIAKVRKKLDKNQKDYFLREEIKVIQDELGESTNIIDEIKQYEDKINEKDLPDEVLEKLKREVQRLKRTQGNTAESSVIRDYLDRVLDLPWGPLEKTEEIDSIENARKILDEDHFGLTKVKERIIEFLAVKSYSTESVSPILCLVGAPGVGKTSIAKSIAKATGRKYNRIALGGVRDESDIRGHRRTYIGAMPGRIITTISKSKVNNPLILLDEIDKMGNGKDLRGDPTSALLEVLDSEQNKTFTDHYVGMEFDISNVMFVCTANNIGNIPDALRDRLEIINLSSYTVVEKENIAKKYLLPKELKRHNLDKKTLKINDDVFYEVIKYYTREAGVRNLDREIAKICRKVVTQIVEGNETNVTIKKSNIDKYLGSRKFLDDTKNNKPQVGIVKGLAYTSVGGTTLSIETVKLKGTGKLEFTGNLGKIMQESARASMSYIRSKSDYFELDDNFYKETDIHIHFPNGATPKDGPSAGIAITTSIVSALTNKPVKHDIAMTGEVTITGRVLPIGGLKDKILGAKNVDIKKIFIPADNKPDYDELEDYVKENVEIVFVENVTEVIDDVLISE